MKLFLPKLQLRDIFAILLSFMLINPLISLSNKFFFVACLVTWLTLAYSSNKLLFIKTIKAPQVLCLLLYLIVLFINMFFGRGRINTHEIILLIVIVFSEYYCNISNELPGKCIIFTSFCYLYLIIMFSLIRLQSNPKLLRILASGDINITLQYGSMFTGNYSHVYFFVTYVSVLSLMIKEGLKRECEYLNIIFPFIFILYSQYTTALLLSAVSVLFIFTSFHKNKTKNYIPLFSLGMLFLVIVYLNLASILSFLINFFQDGSLSLRLGEVKAIIDSHSLLRSGDLNQRILFFSTSLSTFIDNPVFGVGSLSAGYGSQVGGHATFVDQFARYGIIGGSCYWLGIILHLNRLEKNVNFEYKRMYITLIIVHVVVLSLINVTIDAFYYYGMYALMPMMIRTCDIKRQVLVRK